MRDLVARFEVAERAVGGTTVPLTMGGRRVVLRFAGAAMAAKMLPAVVHLVAARASGAADLTVYLWDTRSTGVAMIAPPWPVGIDGVIGAGNVIAGAAADGLRATFRGDNGLLTVLDVEAGVAVVWLRDAAGIDRHEAAAPLRSQLATYFAHHGLAVTHGAAIGREGRGVLLGGRGGSGKSTTSLLCLEAGLDYAGDDYVLIDAGAGAEARPHVHSLYATGKVLPNSRVRMPEIGTAFEDASASAEPGDKAIAYLGTLVPERISRGFEVVALLLPSVTGRDDTGLVPISSAHALRGLAPSTIFQNGDEGPRTLAILARLASQVACYRLELGTDLAQIAPAIERLIAGASGPGALA